MEFVYTRLINMIYLLASHETFNNLNIVLISTHLLSQSLPFYNYRPQGYKTWVHSQTQNKVQWLAACGHVPTSSQ